MQTRAHLGRVVGLRATSRLDALLDAMDQATSRRPCPADWGKYRQRSRWKSIRRLIVTESIW